MFRTLAFVSALVAASLSANTASAQSAATTPQKPAAAPAMKHTPATQIKSDSGAKASASTTHHAAWTKDQIKEAQDGLAKAGLYKGKSTGVLNKDTKKALRAYQKENKLPVTGRLSDSTLAKLKSA